MPSINVSPLDGKLLPLRNKIDAIDAEILRLISARMEVVRSVKEVKDSAQIAGDGTLYFKPYRERIVLNKNLTRGRELGLNDSLVRHVWRCLISEATASEQEMAIGYIADDSDAARASCAYLPGVREVLMESAEELIAAFLDGRVQVVVSCSAVALQALESGAQLMVFARPHNKEGVFFWGKMHEEEARYPGVHYLYCTHQPPEALSNISALKKPHHQSNGMTFALSEKLLGAYGIEEVNSIAIQRESYKQHLLNNNGGAGLACLGFLFE